MKFPMTVAGALSASLLLAGCASIPADRGGSDTAALLMSRSTQAESIAFAPAETKSQKSPQAPLDQIEQLLSASLSADDTVRIALLQSTRMRVLYAELGLAQAEVYDASRLSNPSLGYRRLSGGGRDKTTWSLSQSFTELLFMNYRKRVSRSQWLQAQRRIAAEVLALEADVRSAYYAYVGAELIAQMRGRFVMLSGASSQYAQQLFAAGNISQLQLSREQAQASEALIQQRSAAVNAKAAQARLLTLLGLPMDTPVKTARFDTSLPLPRALHADVPTLRSWAQTQRLDLSALREQVTMMDLNLSHARRWRWFGGVDVTLERETETGAGSLNGVGGSLQLPLFNQGSGALMRARAAMEATQANLAQLELDIGNDMAVRHAAVQAALTNVEEYRQRLMPLREQVVTLTQQQQTFMLIGAFELMSARQQEMDTYQNYLEAVRDYWIAHTELTRAAGGRLPDDAEDEDMGISVGLISLNGEGVAR